VGVQPERSHDVEESRPSILPSASIGFDNRLPDIAEIWKIEVGIYEGESLEEVGVDNIDIEEIQAGPAPERGFNYHVAGITSLQQAIQKKVQVRKEQGCQEIHYIGL